LHRWTHWGTSTLCGPFLKLYGCTGIFEIGKQITQGCLTCQKGNKRVLRSLPSGGCRTAYRPFEKIQIDFTKLPRAGQWKYPLVMVDQLTQWVKAYPAAQATAQTVAKILLEHLIPRFGLVQAIDLDQGAHFTSGVIKNLSQTFRIIGKYHTQWHPESSGRVERMNQTIKQQLTKLMIEINLPWTECLPLALLNIRTKPHSETGISPHEMIYGLPCPQGMTMDPSLVGDKTIQGRIITMANNLRELREKGILALTTPLDFLIHSIQPGRYVLIKCW
ncbi:TF29 protein, partial [Donacobius atricapilla]|nr:TF29 protein [Donacobius atricapilla]